MEGRDVYLVAGLRSHLVLQNGIFKEVPPEKLGAALLRQLCVQVPVAREAQLVIGGNAVGSGGNLTRLMALEAGFPVSTPALTVDPRRAAGRGAGGGCGIVLYAAPAGVPALGRAVYTGRLYDGPVLA